MSALRRLFDWLKPMRCFTRSKHNVHVPETIDVSIDAPDVAPIQSDEREHYEKTLQENERRLAALRARVNAQLRRRS